MLRAHFEGEVSDVCGAEVLYKAELPFGESHRSVPYQKTVSNLAPRIGGVC